MRILKLSICIATFNRGAFVGETLDSILSQMRPDVELIVVDGASPDNTPEVMAQYLLRHPEIRYYREQVNSGVDGDYDKAVGYATGEYCWLMTDDDLLRDGAIACVLNALNSNPELVVVNSEVKNKDFSSLLEERLLNISEDREYGLEDGESFFAEVANYLSFIGGVVIKRQTWLERERVVYYGSLFIHVGVIFQQPLAGITKVIAEPLITIRYGNAMWSPRSFEIWTFKWPQLIWSFSDFSDQAKHKITPREPRKSLRRLLRNRALGAFSKQEVHKFWPIEAGKMELMLANCIAQFPASLANFLGVLYSSLLAKPSQIELHDLLHSKQAAFPSRLLAQLFNRQSRNHK